MTNPDREELVRLADYFATAPDSHAGVAINVPKQRALVVTALRSLASSDSGVKGEPEPVAWRDIVKQPDERPLPTYGQIPWAQLGRDVNDATFGRRANFEFSDKVYPGHQMVLGINFNSLARIVDKYRYYGLPCEANPTVAPPADAGMREALESIKAICVGDKCPNWTDDWQTTNSRGRILDIVDAVLTAPGATTKSDGGVEGHAATSEVVAEKARSVGPGPSDIRLHALADRLRWIYQQPAITLSLAKEVCEQHLQSMIHWLDTLSESDGDYGEPEPNREMVLAGMCKEAIASFEGDAVERVARNANRIWFDTEFIEDGTTIDLISIGMVRSDGATYYAETDQWIPGKASQWVKDNVLVHLKGGNCIKPRDVIAREIVEFAGEKPEFWAYYADYDWVALCQLFGTMMQLPDGWPMFCRDIKQRCVDLGNPKLPEQSGVEHHALVDALWNKQAWEFLATSLVPAVRADEVKDTYLVGGADLKAMSVDIDSNRVIKLHFRRRVTDKDREWLLDAINIKIKADQDAAAIRDARKRG